MAYVVMNSGSRFNYMFGSQTDPSQVQETSDGLTWDAFLPQPFGFPLTFETVGGFIDPVDGKPAGSATAFTARDPEGTLLFSVSDVDVTIARLLQGYDSADPEHPFWESLLSGDDHVVGSDVGEILPGYGGDDSVEGMGGDDSLFGGRGDDTLDGGDGADTVSFVGSAAASINLATGLATAGASTASLVSVENALGSLHADTIVGSIVANALNGEAGDDAIYGAGGRDTINGQDGDDTLQAGADEDRADGGAGDDFLNGEAGDDILRGGGDEDQIYGGQGDDRLVGGASADVLRGGGGDDTLFGGGGHNGLYGGAGDDTFVFGAKSDYVASGAGHDRLELTLEGSSVEVGDFDVAQDTIALDVARPDETSVQDLINRGALEISGTDGYTLIKFGASEMVLQDLGVDDFSTDALTLF